MGKVQNSSEEAAVEQIPRAKKKIKQKWMTEDILEFNKQKEAIKK